MSTELELAKFLKCLRCGAALKRKNLSDALYSCDGDNVPHPPYVVSSKFDIEGGVLEEGPWVPWWEKVDGDGKKK